MQGLAVWSAPFLLKSPLKRHFLFKIYCFVSFFCFCLQSKGESENLIE